MLILLVAVLMTSGSVFAQNVMRLVPANEGGVSIAEQIEADTTANGDRIAGRIYELDGGAIYLNRGTYYLEAGDTLHLRSSSDVRATIYNMPTQTGTNPQNPAGYIFRNRGGLMILENLAFTGYDEASDIANQNYDQLYTVQGGMFRTDASGGSFVFRGNIFSNINGQILRTDHSVVKVIAEDNIFSNLGALSTSNFGAGKGIDLRASTCDTLILVNNTFANYIDRPIRHYNFGNPLEGTGDILYGLIDHNTFVNGIGFHGVLSLGNVGPNITITNNLFVDGFAGGEDSTDVTRTAEWANTGSAYNNGNPEMSWIFAAPNDTTVWTINNNFYSISATGQAHFDKFQTDSMKLGEGSPLSTHIQSRISNSATAFTKIPDPGMIDIPSLMIGMMEYYIEDAGRTKDTPNGTWDPATQDMDRKPITYYLDTFDASYSTSSDAYIGAEGGFPAGDLNWFPAKKNEWMGTDIDDNNPEVPSRISLNQNYPNPFNPSTKISFSLPSSQKVTLKVYDMLGREVATLVNGQTISAGSHTVNFDAVNLSSGVYIYQLTGSNVSLTRRMTLIK